MNQTQQIENYEKKVSRKILASPPTRDRCINILDNSIEEHLQQYPEANFESIVQTFGQPKEIAKEYMQGIDPEEIQKYKRKRLLSWIIPSSILLVLICVLLTIGYFYIIDRDPGLVIQYPSQEVTSQYDFTGSFEN